LGSLYRLPNYETKQHRTFLVPSWSLAIRVKDVTDEFGGLATGHVVVGTIVGSIIWWDAWLKWSTVTRVPVDVAALRQALYIEPEGATLRHILKGLSGRRLSESRSIHDELRDLPARDVVIGAEI
jgi:hypothetical protein